MTKHEVFQLEAQHVLSKVRTYRVLHVCSSNASITSELLAQMLETIGNTGVFKRGPDDGVPFLLSDGHHSQSRLFFLNYINNPLHHWKVFIGVPYATHMWQPHDSSEVF
jgi:hypothetical protein